MNTLVSLLCLGLLVFLGKEAVTLHKLTVCRQEAWRSSVTLHTRTLLTKTQPSERDILYRCGIVVSRNQRMVAWMRSMKRHSVPLGLKGKL
jgi:hypothetical protein